MGGMVVFRHGPCETKDELYNRDAELKNIVRLIRHNTWVAILGLRMSGKTSVAKAAMNDLRHEFFVAYVDLRGAHGARKATERIIKSIPKKDLERLGDFVQRNLESVSVGKDGSTLSVKLRPRVTSADALEEMFIQLVTEKKVLMVLDEMQEIGGGVNYLLETLARIRNTSRKVNFIFTGSEVNMMRALLSTDEKNPLHGRSPVKIEIEPWSTEKAKDFLKSGLKEEMIRYDEREIDDTVAKFGTLPGWLSFYGLRRMGGLSHRRSLEEAEKESVSVARKELKSTLSGRGAWARKVIRILGGAEARWTTLQETTSAPRKGLSDFLEMLTETFVVTEEGGLYRLSDPVYKRAAESLTGRRLD